MILVVILLYFLYTAEWHNHREKVNDIKIDNVHYCFGNEKQHENNL